MLQSLLYSVFVKISRLQIKSMPLLEISMELWEQWLWLIILTLLVLFSQCLHGQSMLLAKQPWILTHQQMKIILELYKQQLKYITITLIPLAATTSLILMSVVLMPMAGVSKPAMKWSCHLPNQVFPTCSCLPKSGMKVPILLTANKLSI